MPHFRKFAFVLHIERPCVHIRDIPTPFLAQAPIPSPPAVLCCEARTFFSVPERFVPCQNILLHARTICSKSVQKGQNVLAWYNMFWHGSKRSGTGTIHSCLSFVAKTGSKKRCIKECKTCGP